MAPVQPIGAVPGDWPSVACQAEAPGGPHAVLETDAPQQDPTVAPEAEGQEGPGGAVSGGQCQRSGSCLHTDSSLPLPLWPQDKFQLKMPRRSSSPGSLPCLPWALWCPVIDIEDIPPWPNTVFLSCGGALQEWRPGSFRPSHHDGAGSGMGSGVLVSYRWTMWDHGCWTQALQC